MQGYQLLLYGDSLAEAWRGTDHCKPCDETIRTTCKGAPEVLQAYFGRRWRVGVAGIAGDQAANLIWRLQNGQLPTSSFQVRAHSCRTPLLGWVVPTLGRCRKPAKLLRLTLPGTLCHCCCRPLQPRVAILFIGTNDLGAAAWGKSVRRAARALKSAVPGVAERWEKNAFAIPFCAAACSSSYTGNPSLFAIGGCLQGAAGGATYTERDALHSSGGDGAAST